MFVSLKRNNLLFIVLLYIHIGIIFADDNKCSIEHCEKCSDETKCEKCKEGYTLNFSQTKCLELLKNSNKQSGSAQKSSTSSSKTSGSAKKSSNATPSGSAKKSSNATPSGSAKKSSNATPSGSAKKSSNATPSGSAKKSSNASPSGSAKKSSNATPSGSAKKSSSLAKKSSASKSSGSAKKSSITSGSGKSSNASTKKASNAPVASNKAFSSAFEGNLAEETNYTSLICKIAIYCCVGICVICVIRWLLAKRKKNKVGYFYDESGNPEEKAKVVYIQ